MPISSRDSHKLIYVIRNKKKKTSKKILILPYLHERKIYLHKAKSGVDYFQTTYRKVVEIDNDNNG